MKAKHPDRELFDYLRGALEEQERAAVERHLCGCSECASVAAAVGALKERACAASQAEHPDVSEIASFFYGKVPRARKPAVAAHVAICRSCTAELAEYARAERTARSFEGSGAELAEVPAAAWEMIRDWEESSFAEPKTAHYELSDEVRSMLSELVAHHRHRLDQFAGAAGATSGDQVAVIVVDRLGHFRGIEMFERTRDWQGAEVLTHAEHSERFDNKPLHALLDFGGERRVVVSDVIRRNMIRLKPAERPSELQSAHYFIIED